MGLMIQTPKTKTDKHFLRGLLWCGLNGDLMIPTVNECGKRYYGCPDRRCPRPLVPAEEVEQLVWARYTALNEEMANQVSRLGRHDALVAVLYKVTVSTSFVELDYAWRD